jgi:predicted RNA-binding protein with PUA-like domain
MDASLTPLNLARATAISTPQVMGVVTVVSLLNEKADYSSCSMNSSVDRGDPRHLSCQESPRWSRYDVSDVQT